MEDHRESARRCPPDCYFGRNADRNNSDGGGGGRGRSGGNGSDVARACQRSLRGAVLPRARRHGRRVSRARSPDRRSVALKRMTSQAAADVARDVATSTGSPIAAAWDAGRSRRLALAREFRTLATLRHPNIISVLDYGFAANAEPFFTMELLAQPRTLLQEASDRPTASARPARAGAACAVVSASPRRDPPRPQAVERAGGATNASRARLRRRGAARRGRECVGDAQPHGARGDGRRGGDRGVRSLCESA